MSEIIWRPYGDYVEKSNVARFMNRHGIESAEDLIERSTRNIEWFWGAALEDLDLRWYEPYTQLLDASRGIEWARWFVGGRTNTTTVTTTLRSTGARERRRARG